MVGRPHVAAHGLDRAVLPSHLHLVGARGHLPSAVAVAVLDWRAVHQVHPVEDEAVTLREGVGPGEALVEAHLHARRAEQRHAVDVELSWQGEVALPEPGLSAPREVRVGQHHAAAGRGDVTAERPPVARRGRGAERVHRRGRMGSVGSRGLCPPDQLREVAPRREQGHVAEVRVQVELVDRADPLGRGAPLGQPALVEQLGEAGVVAGDVAGDQVAHLVRLLVAQPRGALDDAEDPVAEVGGQVGARVALAVEEGAFAADLHDLVRDRRQVVPGDGPALAEAEVAPAAGADVGDTVGGPADLGLVPAGAGVRRGHGRVVLRVQKFETTASKTWSMVVASLARYAVAFDASAIRRRSPASASWP